MEFFQVDLLGTGGAERVRAPFCSCAAPLACTPSPSPCMQPFPLRASPLVLPSPLARGPFPCRPPFSFRAASAGLGGTGQARKPEGATGAAMLVERPTQRGRVSKWGSRGNGGGQRTFCTPCLCGKVGVVGRRGRGSGAGRRGIEVVVVVATATANGRPACARGEVGWMLACHGECNGPVSKGGVLHC